MRGVEVDAATGKTVIPVQVEDGSENGAMLDHAKMGLKDVNEEMMNPVYGLARYQGKQCAVVSTFALF